MPQFYIEISDVSLLNGSLLLDFDEQPEVSCAGVFRAIKARSMGANEDFYDKPLINAKHHKRIIIREPKTIGKDILEYRDGVKNDLTIPVFRQLISHFLYDFEDFEKEPHSKAGVVHLGYEVEHLFSFLYSLNLKKKDNQSLQFESIKFIIEQVTKLDNHPFGQLSIDEDWNIIDLRKNKKITPHLVKKIVNPKRSIGLNQRLYWISNRVRSLSKSINKKKVFYRNLGFVVIASIVIIFASMKMFNMERPIHSSQLPPVPQIEDSSSFRLLILPLNPDSDCKINDTKYEQILLDRYRNLKFNEKLNITVDTLLNVDCPVDVYGAIWYGFLSKADMVIWGNYDETCSDYHSTGEVSMKIQYALIDTTYLGTYKLNVQDTLTPIHSLNQLRTGYLQETVDDIIYLSLAVASMSNRDHDKSLSYILGVDHDLGPLVTDVYLYGFLGKNDNEAVLKFPDSLFTSATHYALKAMALYNLERYEESNNLMDSVLRNFKYFHGGRGIYLTSKARALIALERRDEAIAYVDTILSLGEPRLIDPLKWKLNYFFGENKNMVGAREMIVRILRRDESNPVANYFAGLQALPGGEYSYPYLRRNLNDRKLKRERVKRLDQAINHFSIAIDGTNIRKYEHMTLTYYAYFLKALKDKYAITGKLSEIQMARAKIEEYGKLNNYDKIYDVMVETIDDLDNTRK